MNNEKQVQSQAMIPAERFHLAEILEEEMKERGWDMTTLVMNMGPFYTEREFGVAVLSWEMFFAVRSPNMILGDDMARQLADAFGISPKFFTNLHEGWREWAANRPEIAQSRGNDVYE